MDYSGLTVKGGRLINNRPVGKSGIEEASEIRKAKLYNAKVEVVADGIARADMRKDLRVRIMD